MNFEPLFGLGFHMFSVPHHYLDVLVAGAIAVGTLLYMTRIAGISVFYGIGSRSARHDDAETAAQPHA